MNKKQKPTHLLIEDCLRTIDRARTSLKRKYVKRETKKKRSNQNERNSKFGYLERFKPEIRKDTDLNDSDSDEDYNFLIFGKEKLKQIKRREREKEENKKAEIKLQTRRKYRRKKIQKKNLNNNNNDNGNDEMTNNLLKSHIKNAEQALKEFEIEKRSKQRQIENDPQAKIAFGNYLNDKYLCTILDPLPSLHQIKDIRKYISAEIELLTSEGGTNNLEELGVIEEQQEDGHDEEEGFIDVDDGKTDDEGEYEENKDEGNEEEHADSDKNQLKLKQLQLKAMNEKYQDFLNSQREIEVEEKNRTELADDIENLLHSLKSQSKTET